MLAGALLKLIEKARRSLVPRLDGLKRATDRSSRGTDKSCQRNCRGMRMNFAGRIGENIRGSRIAVASRGYLVQACFHAGGAIASTRMNAIRQGFPLLLTQAWLVPCWTRTSPAAILTSLSSMSMSISPSRTIA